MRGAGVALGLAVVGALVCAVIGTATEFEWPCGSSSAPTTSADSTPAPVSTPVEMMELVEYGGCSEVVRDAAGLACLYEAGGSLRLWITHAQATEARVLVDGTPRETEPHPLHTEPEPEPGQGHLVPLRSGDQELRVELPGVEPWSLRLREQSPLSAAHRARIHALQARANELGEPLRQGDAHALVVLERSIHAMARQGALSKAVRLAARTSFFAATTLADPAGAERLLEDLRASVQGDPESIATLEIYRSRPLRLRGNRLQAVLAARRGSQIARRVDHSVLQIDGLTEYAYLLAELGYFEVAVDWQAKALALAQRIDSSQVGRLLEMTAATHLLLAEAGQPHDDPSEYYGMLAERSGPEGASPSPPLLAAAHLGLARVALLRGAPRHAQLLLRQLDRDQLPRRRHAAASSLALEVQLALRADPTELAPRLAELEALLPTAVEPAVHWRAAVLEGRVHEALGRAQAAQRAYERSEALLDTMLPLAALGLGGETVVARLDEGTQRLLALLLRDPTPRPDEALCVARRALARRSRLALLHEREPATAGRGDEPSPQVEHYLERRRAYERAIQQSIGLADDALVQAKREQDLLLAEVDKSALELLVDHAAHELRPSCEQLSPRAEGELLLALHPLGDDLLVIAADDRGTTHHRIPKAATPSVEAGEQAELAGALLDPLDERVEQAERIRVLAGGPASRIHVHALRWRDDALVMRRPVVYGLELPSPGGPSPPAPQPASPELRAVVLGDSRVVDATALAASTGERLEDLGLSVDVYSTKDAKSAEIRTRLPNAAYFVYVGHAHYSSDATVKRPTALPSAPSPAPPDPWPPQAGGATSQPSYLPLDDHGAQLRVADVSTSTPAPRVVVLLGCGTGTLEAGKRQGGQSLATAFLGAGADVAIASTRTVEAREAIALGRGLRHHLSSQSAADPGRWVQQAMQWARDERPGQDQDWSTESIADFRVFVR